MAGGGVGEAMLLGAAMGGGSAALTGGDPLRGALLGGLTGGVGSGVEGSLTGAAPKAAIDSGVGMAATGGAGLGGVGGYAGAAGDFGSLASGASGAAPSGVSSLSAAISDPLNYLKANPGKMTAAGIAGATGARPSIAGPEEYNGPLSRFRFNPDTYQPSYPTRYAEGGIAALHMSNYDIVMDKGGIADLGSYSDGGQMLKGPGDGMSDNIPASIGGDQPARLADGEFVIPSDVVSHLGNGSTDAGARQLYSMMDRIRQARTGRKAQGEEIDPSRYIPA